MSLYLLAMALQSGIIQEDTFPIQHYYLCNYVPLTAGKDELSRSLLRFKNRLEVDLTAWVECSVSVLEPLISSDFSIVRALGHEEKVATYSALDHIGVKLSEVRNCSYNPQRLKKKNLPKPLKTLNRVDRVKALDGVYSFDERAETDFSDFLIIDDILTTGTTAISIATAIRKKIFAARILVFTLAKVDYDLQMNEQATFESPHFRWMEKAWEVREAGPQYDTLPLLKRKILTDSF